MRIHTVAEGFVNYESVHDFGKKGEIMNCIEKRTKSVKPNKDYRSSGKNVKFISSSYIDDTICDRVYSGTLKKIKHCIDFFDTNDAGCKYIVESGKVIHKYSYKCMKVQ